MLWGFLQWKLLLLNRKYINWRGSCTAQDRMLPSIGAIGKVRRRHRAQLFFLRMWDLIHPLHFTPVKRLFLLYDYLFVSFFMYIAFYHQALYSLPSKPPNEWMSVSPLWNLWYDLSFVAWPEPRDELHSVDVTVQSCMCVCLRWYALHLFCHLCASVKQDVRVHL